MRLICPTIAGDVSRLVFNMLRLDMQKTLNQRVVGSSPSASTISKSPVSRGFSFFRGKRWGKIGVTAGDGERRGKASAGGSGDMPLICIGEGSEGRREDPFDPGETVGDEYGRPEENEGQGQPQQDARKR